MAYEPTKIDTSADKLVTGFKNPGASGDGTFARMVFVARGGAEVPIAMPAELIDKFLPDPLEPCSRMRTPA